MILVIENQKNVKPNVKFQDGMLFFNCNQETIDKVCEKTKEEKKHDTTRFRLE